MDLAAGKEIEIYKLIFARRPASESGNNGFSALFETGMFRAKYERLATTDIDNGRNKLATWKLELKFKDADKTGDSSKNKAPELPQDGKDGFIVGR